MSILAIVSLITTVAPKLIGAGMDIYSIWKDAGAVIANAEANGGKVDPDAYAILVQRCTDANKVLQDRAAAAP